MNAKMLMLGILLLAGLSFAITPNWMMYAVNRYDCNFDYNYKGYVDGGEYVGLRWIVNEYDDGYWDTEAMEDHLDYMGDLVWGDGITGMCDYSGCWHPPYPSGFRANMLQYNTAAAGYKVEFLAGLKAFIADNPGARSAVLAYLQEATMGYRACLAENTRYCDGCPH